VCRLRALGDYLNNNDLDLDVRQISKLDQNCVDFCVDSSHIPLTSDLSIFVPIFVSMTIDLSIDTQIDLIRNCSVVGGEDG